MHAASAGSVENKCRLCRSRSNNARCRSCTVRVSEKRDGRSASSSNVVGFDAMMNSPRTALASCQLLLANNQPHLAQRQAERLDRFPNLAAKFFVDVLELRGRHSHIEHGAIHAKRSCGLKPGVERQTRRLLREPVKQRGPRTVVRRKFR